MRNPEDLFNFIDDRLIVKADDGSYSIPEGTETMLPKGSFQQMEINILNYLNTVAASGKKPNEKMGQDQLTEVLPELLSNDLNQLQRLKSKLEFIYDKDVKLSSEGQYALVTLISATQNKMDILQNKTNTLIKEIEKLNKEILEEKSEKIINEKQKTIHTIEQSIAIAKSLQDSTYQKKAERIIDTIAMLRQALIKFPANEISVSINATQSKYIELLQKMREPVTAETDKAVEHLLAECKTLCDRNISMLCSTLLLDIKELANAIPPSEYASLNDQYAALRTEWTKLLHPEDNLRQYNQLLENFQKAFSQLAVAQQLAETRPYTIQYRQSAVSAAEHVRNELPEKEYPYLLKGRDLRESANPTLVDNLTYTKVKIPNPDQYIMGGSLTPSGTLSQIAKDGERNLKFNGEFNRTIVESDLNNETIKAQYINFLKQQFGDQNAENLMKHYDQGVSAFISGVPSSAIQPFNRDDKLIAINIGPASHYLQNLYNRNDVTFRDSVANEIVLLIPQGEDPDDTLRWTFKTNIKALTWISKEGFVVEGVGSDSSFIINCLMQKNNYADAQLLVDTILKFDKKFEGKSERLGKGSSSEAKGPHKQIINDMKESVQSFKDGIITFDELVAKAIELEAAAKNLPHASAKGKILGFLSGAKTGTADVMKEFKDALVDIKNKFDTKAAQYIRVQPEVKLDESVRSSASMPQSQNR